MACLRHFWPWSSVCTRCLQEQEREPMIRQIVCTAHRCTYLEGSRCEACAAELEGAQPPERELDPDHVGSCGVHGNYYNASGRCPVCEENTRASVGLHRAWQRSLPNEMDTWYRQQLRDCAQLDVPHLAVSDAGALSYADVYRPSCRQPLEFVCKDEEEIHLIAQTFIYGMFFGIGEDFATVGLYGGPNDEAYFVGFVIEDPWRNVVVHVCEDRISDSSSEYRATTLHMNLRKVDEMLPVEHPDPVAKPGRKIRARPRKGEPK